MTRQTHPNGSAGSLSGSGLEKVRPSQKQVAACPGICTSLLCSSFCDFCLDVGKFLSLFCELMPIHENLKTDKKLKPTAQKFSDVTKKNPTLLPGHLFKCLHFKFFLGIIPLLDFH